MMPPTIPSNATGMPMMVTHNATTTTHDAMLPTRPSASERMGRAAASSLSRSMRDDTSAKSTAPKPKERRRRRGRAADLLAALAEEAVAPRSRALEDGFRLVGVDIGVHVVLVRRVDDVASDDGGRRFRASLRRSRRDRRRHARRRRPRPRPPTAVAVAVDMRAVADARRSTDDRHVARHVTEDVGRTAHHRDVFHRLALLDMPACTAGDEAILALAAIVTVLVAMMPRRAGRGAGFVVVIIVFDRDTQLRDRRRLVRIGAAGGR